MKSLKESLANEVVKPNKFESPCQLVSTRGSKCAILLGPNMDQPYNEEEVKSICKDMKIKFQPIDDFFEEEEIAQFYSSMLPGAVIENDELVWYDMYDGTVNYYTI